MSFIVFNQVDHKHLFYKITALRDLQTFQIKDSSSNYFHLQQINQFLGYSTRNINQGIKHSLISISKICESYFEDEITNNEEKFGFLPPEELRSIFKSLWIIKNVRTVNFINKINPNKNTSFGIMINEWIVDCWFQQRWYQLQNIMNNQDPASLDWNRWCKTDLTNWLIKNEYSFSPLYEQKRPTTRQLLESSNSLLIKYFPLDSQRIRRHMNDLVFASNLPVNSQHHDRSKMIKSWLTQVLSEWKSSPDISSKTQYIIKRTIRCRNEFLRINKINDDIKIMKSVFSRLKGKSDVEIEDQQCSILEMMIEWKNSRSIPIRKLTTTFISSQINTSFDTNQTVNNLNVRRKSETNSLKKQKIF